LGLYFGIKHPEAQVVVEKVRAATVIRTFEMPG
jgi:hypothetical protein